MLTRLYRWLFAPPSTATDRELLHTLVHEVMRQARERDAAFAEQTLTQTQLLTNWLEMFKPKPGVTAKGWINDDRNMALREAAEKLERETVPFGDNLTEVERVNELARMMDKGW
jgi:hypothetical protein